MAKNSFSLRTKLIKANLVISTIGSAAETRWFDKGITRDDLLSMSDEQLPFDAKIGEAGFPTDYFHVSRRISLPKKPGQLGRHVGYF